MASVGRRGGARVLVSPTDDMGMILGSLHDASVAGRLNLVEGVQVAQLALKHRRNKNGGQRIVLFVGSPVEADSKALVKAGKLLKKNNIALDVVLLGGDEDSADKLRQFVEAAKSHDNSHLVQIPPGVVPSDVLISSPVIQPDGGSGGGGGAGGAVPGEDAGGGPAGFGGVDANLDPELAMALRVSMEEERARQQAAAAAAADQGAAQDETAASQQPVSTEGGGQDATPAAADVAMDIPSDIPAMAAVDDDDDALLQQALAMSMREHAASQEAAASAPPTSDSAPAATPADEPPAAETTTTTMLVDEDDDETMQLALQMSMQASQEAQEKEGGDTAMSDAAAPAKEAEATTAQSTTTGDSSSSPSAFYDPGFVNQILSQLPGVDPNDPAIKAALDSIRPSDAPKDDKKDEADKK